MIEGEYNPSELHETIKLKAFWKVKEYFPLALYDEISIEYSKEELKIISKTSPKLKVRVFIPCGSEEKIEYDVCIDLCN